jgi:tRNA-specific 2-thiouridylase
LNWLGDDDISSDEIEVSVKLRSMQDPQKAFIKADENNRAIVTMTDPTRAITKGQACVIYDGDRVLGGGWIDGVIDSSN